MSYIDIGAVAEYSTASELLARGITPCWPSVETQPYDMIGDTGTTTYKIQVKGCRHKGPKVRVNVKMSAGHGKARAYTKADVDFVIIYLFEFDLYYVIPVEDVVKDMVIQPSASRCRWAKFKEAWGLIK